MKKKLLAIINKFGYNLVKTDLQSSQFKMHDAAFMEIYDECKEFTMTSIERMYAIYTSVNYVVKNKIPGDMIECGVWRGGSSMMIAKTLVKLGDTDRKLYLFDTFEGMVLPTEKDVSFSGESAKETFFSKNGTSTGSDWCAAEVDEVKLNMSSTHYPPQNIIYIKGKVEETLPTFTCNDLSILRLDTDWYESTKCEMEFLFPKLVQKGVLLIDDYGHWEGARQAIDEYIQQNNIPILLNRVDYTGRAAIKV